MNKKLFRIWKPKFVAALMENPLKGTNFMRTKTTGEDGEARCCLCVMQDRTCRTRTAALRLTNRDNKVPVDKGKFEEIMGTINPQFEVFFYDTRKKEWGTFRDTAAAFNDSIAKAYGGISHKLIAQFVDNFDIPNENKRFSFYLVGEDTDNRAQLKLVEIKGFKTLEELKADKSLDLSR